MFRSLSVALALSILGVSSSAQEETARPLRAGMIGLDTSHVVAFTRVLNSPDREGPIAGVEVVAAYPGGSPDIEASASRVEEFTTQLRDDYGIEIVDSIEELLTKVDVVFLESVDGRPHLEQARPVIEAGKPLFIDKPVAGSLADAIEIFQLAGERDVPCFSSSSLRFSPALQELRESEAVGEIVGCDSYGPSSLEKTHPDLFWYGIHGVEALFTIMGPGCETVSRVQTKGTEFVTGVWEGGRVGTFRGIREGRSGYGVTVFGTNGIVQGGGSGGYEPMLVEICKFFQTGEPPVSARETIEIFAFMEAADESKRQGGKPVSIAEVLKKAQDEVAQRQAAAKDR
ncbi:Gfo/Idh/MocA family oxidoreductase [soil metagenome]